MGRVRLRGRDESVERAGCAEILSSDAKRKFTLTATSDGLGQGTTFEMELPLWDLMNGEGDIESNLNNLEATEITGAVSMTSFQNTAPKCILKVLVVDDVKSNRKLLMRLLEKKGHICFEAEGTKR